MFGKLLLIILTAGGTAAGLLVIRQDRIETAHRMAQAHARILEHERALWQLRAEIAASCRPAAVREMIAPLPDSWQAVPDPTNPRAATAPGLVSAPAAPAPAIANPGALSAAEPGTIEP